MGGAESISQLPSILTKEEVKLFSGSDYDEELFNSMVDPTTNTVTKEQLIKVLTRTDVFLTHDWGHELGQDNHAKVGMINKLIKSRGLSTWFDEEKMEGNIKKQMAAGIDNAQCVVVFITKRYVDKVAGTNTEDNCQLEFNYSARRKGANKMIAVVMEERMRNDSAWVGEVGLVLGGRLYVDMTGDFGDADYLNRCVDDLYRRIIKVIGKPVPTIDVNINPNIHTPNNFINNNNNNNKDDYYSNLFSKCICGDLNSFNELESQSRIEVENIVCLGYLMIILNKNVHTPNNIPKDNERSKSIGREIIGKLKEKEISSSLNHHEEFILGVMYYYGIEVNKDCEEAVKWYRLSSDKGHSDAQYNYEIITLREKKIGYYSLKNFLFIISQLFLLVVPLLVVQFPLLNDSNLNDPTSQNHLITDQGDSKAQCELGECYYYGEGVDKDYKLSSDQGHSSAQNNLGNQYYNGEGVNKDYEEAIKWYRLSADQGNSDAQYNLGLCYDYGIGVNQDYKEAVKWYKLSADQGHSYAQNNLGLCYKNGEGVNQDYEEAVKWYRLSADQGKSEAQNNLGNQYYNGKGVNKDYAEAVKWYKLSANQGNSYAQYNLGVCYKNGFGVNQDYKEAVKWYKLSSDQGNSYAQNALNELKK